MSCGACDRGALFESAQSQPFRRDGDLQLRPRNAPDRWDQSGKDPTEDNGSARRD